MLNENNLQELEPQEKKEQKRKKPILTEAEIIKRNKRKTKTAVAAFILILAVGVGGNWYYQNTDVSNTLEPLISASSRKTLGEAELVDATTSVAKESEYFSSARLDRQNARDEALGKLQKVLESASESDDAKQVASEQIAKLSAQISIENKIETLVCAKGVKNCLAVISEDSTRVDIIVDVEELSDTLALQIKEIATAQLKCSFENVSIIQSN